MSPRKSGDATEARGRVLVVPDSFKGTHSAVQVADAIGRGLRRAGLEVDLCPAADGGEGTLDTLAQALDAERVTMTVTDPLGRPITADFGIRDDLAIVETASASGLQLVDAAERDAVASSTAGTGQLIAAAVRAGARTIYLGVGGSATTDGGWGAVRAITRAGGLRGARLTVLCDVTTPFEHAAELFAAQKGATEADIKELSARLHGLARAYPRDPRGMQMGGAAGGLAGGLWAALGAELVRGAAFVLDAVGFNGRLETAQLAVTGEGKLDSQSVEGKLLSEVTRRARTAGVAVYAIVGRRALESGDARSMGISRVVEASTLQEIEAAAFAIGSERHSHTISTQALDDQKGIIH